MLKSLLVWIALAVSLTANPARLEIAVVDMEAVFKANPETAKAEARLRDERRKAAKEMNTKAAALKKLLHEHQQVTRKLVAAGKDPDEALAKQADDLLEKASALERELATLRTTRESDLEREFVAERRRILARITAAIEQYNHDGRFALILDRSAASSNGIPQVLHAPGTEDITEQIIAAAAKND
jgi:Skp family chaperone for outer membrane proteins